MEPDLALSIYDDNGTISQESTRPVIAKSISKAQKYTLIATQILKTNNIIRVNSTGQYYYLPQDDPSTYRPLDDRTLEVWARDAYFQAFGAAEPKDIRNTASLTLTMVTSELPTLDNDLIFISQNTYWSINQGKLVKNPQTPCFRRLFDTDFPDKHTVTIPPFTDEQLGKLWYTYSTTLKTLDKTNGEPEDEPYQFVTTWANGNHDVYLDLVRSISYCFVKKKPVGSYVLVGLRRNGKSAFAGMLHTIFGRNNTSMVRLSQLGDPHYVNEISTTMMNAPDEEDEKAIDAQATFKSISDHGLLTLSVMRENKPLKVACNFMSFFPMNHVPEWKGTGAAACLKRTLVLPFYADLSEYDKKNYNFAEETFTADLMCEFMGYILAFANYYSHHELKFSPTMLKEQATLEEEQDSALAYLKLFDKYFYGFSSISLLHSDYFNWCRANDFRAQTKQEFRFVFRQYIANRKSVMVDGHVKKAYCVPNNSSKQLFMEDSRFPEVGSVAELHEKSLSVVERLEAYYVEKFGDFAKDVGEPNTNQELDLDLSFLDGEEGE